MEGREVQYEKALSPILVTEGGMFMKVRERHSLKAPFPILVTEEGMLMEVRELQYEKALSPILVTEEGMFMEVRELQYEKALLSILETRYPLTYFCISTVELFLSLRPTTTASCSCSFTSYLTPFTTTSLAHEGRAHSIPTITKRQWRTSARDLNDLILFMFCRLISRPFRVPHPPKRMRPPTRDEVILLLDLRNCLLLIVKLFVL